jgi:cytochrome c-type biogenesis protein CcmH
MSGAGPRLNLGMKALQACTLALAVCFLLGAGDPASRFTRLNHRLMCTCGCSEILGECNHVGCQSSGQELDELHKDISAGMNDQQILDSFVAKYGATVLAAPSTHGFDLVAWIAPFAVFAAALLGTILLVRRWTGGMDQYPAAAGPINEELRNQIRRETGGDGGD